MPSPKFTIPKMINPLSFQKGTGNVPNPLNPSLPLFAHLSNQFHPRGPLTEPRPEVAVLLDDNPSCKTRTAVVGLLEHIRSIGDLRYDDLDYFARAGIPASSVVSIFGKTFVQKLLMGIIPNRILTRLIYASKYDGEIASLLTGVNSTFVRATVAYPAPGQALPSQLRWQDPLSGDTYVIHTQNHLSRKNLFGVPDVALAFELVSPTFNCFLPDGSKEFLYNLGRSSKVEVIYGFPQVSNRAFTVDCDDSILGSNGSEIVISRWDGAAIVPAVRTFSDPFFDYVLDLRTSHEDEHGALIEFPEDPSKQRVQVSGFDLSSDGPRRSLVESFFESESRSTASGVSTPIPEKNSFPQINQEDVGGIVMGIAKMAAGIGGDISNLATALRHPKSLVDAAGGKEKLLERFRSVLSTNLPSATVLDFANALDAVRKLFDIPKES